MKVTATREPASFTPVSLRLTLENEKEARALYALFNHADVLAAFTGVGGDCDAATEVRRMISMHVPAADASFHDFQILLAQHLRVRS